MKATTFVATLLISFIGCTQQQSDQLSQQQKDQIKKEVKAAVDSMIARDERLDADGVMQYYSPNLIAFSPDGSQSDYPAMKKGLAEMFNGLASLKILVTRENFIVLSKDIVIDAWLGKSGAVLKSGDTMVFDPDAVTLVFRKIGDKWKVIYQHESAATSMQMAKK